MKTQSRAFRTSDWAEGLSSNRTVTLSTQQEWLIHNAVNVLEWPSHSLGMNAINISGETWKMCICSHPPDRACDVKRWGEWQITAKFWYAKLVISYPKRLEAVKVLQLSTELRVYEDLYNVLISVFLLLINLRSCDNSVFALSLWCTECRLMWKKSNSKQFNIRRQHKTWKKWRGMKTFYRHCVYKIYIYIYIYTYAVYKNIGNFIFFLLFLSFNWLRNQIHCWTITNKWFVNVLQFFSFSFLSHIRQNSFCTVINAMSSSTELFIYFIFYLEMTEKSTNKPYIVAIVCLMSSRFQRFLPFIQIIQW